MDWSRHKTDLADAYGAAMVKDGQAAAICAVADRAVELAQPKPSGQMAEDAAEARALAMIYCGDHCAKDGSDDERHTERCEAARAALSRLAALASDTAASREATAKAWAEAEALRAMADSQRRLTNKLHCERDSARAEVLALMTRTREVEAERDAARAEVERLKNWREKCIKDNNDWAARLTAAESRLAAIREKTKRQLSAVRKALVKERARVRPSQARVSELWMVEVALEPLAKAMEGDAPEEATTTLVNVMDHGGTLVLSERGVTTLDGRPPRYPCSPTCTHDDAATPGHPERVKRRSAAITKATQDGIFADGYAEGHEEGAEAMRAACWEAIQEVLRRDGMHPTSTPWTTLKAAIEGAAP